MVCGGFSCSKNALAALNVLYILVSFLLIGIGAAAKASAFVTSVAVTGGIIACGVFLLLIAVIGLIGAIKHHQVLLFFYMIILFLLFLIQFAVACGCLAVNAQQQKDLVTKGWGTASPSIKSYTQNILNCCGFDEDHQQNITNSLGMGHPSCHEIQCCKDQPEFACCQADSKFVNGTQIVQQCGCDPCWKRIESRMDTAMKVAGAVGLVFSFTEILGVWLALRYRNLKDPRANPSAFL